MTIIHAVILGIVEGITEFLPVSSTGHLILAAKFLDLSPTEFLKSFEISIQVGAMLAVVWLYRKSWAVHTGVWKRLLVAFLPTAAVGFLLYKNIKNSLIGNENVVLWSLLLGGVFLIVFERLYKEKPDAEADVAHIPLWKAALIGLCQSLAVIPGVSRSAATIVGGLSLGMNRRTVVEFSFLLAVPTLLAASVWDLIHSAPAFSPDQFTLLAIGFVVSFLVAGLSIRFLLYYIGRYSFVAFGFYRIAIALLFWTVLR